ncbi:MAG: SGNH/GDSL hydrolase family protein [Vicinamibacteria bacterium]
MKGLPRWAANLCLALGGVFVSLLIAEVLLRWTGYQYRPLKIGLDDADQRSSHIFDDRHFVYDPDALWRPKPSSAVFNAQGFRGPELSLDKPVDEFRVYAVGDSNTLGVAEAAWPGDLQSIFRKSCGARVQVVNAGVWGYTSTQGLSRIEEIGKFDPDLVLISFGANDAHPVRIPDKGYTVRAAWSRRLENILQPSHVARLAIGVLTRVPALGTGEMTHRVSLEDYRSNLVKMAERVRSGGAVPVFVTRPYHGVLMPAMGWKSFAHEYNAVTAEVAASLDLPLVDLYTHFKDREDVFTDESHFNPEGHRLAAQIVYQRIQPFIRGSGLADCVQPGSRPDDSD